MTKMRKEVGHVQEATPLMSAIRPKFEAVAEKVEEQKYRIPQFPRLPRGWHLTHPSPTILPLYLLVEQKVGDLVVLDR